MEIVPKPAELTRTVMDFRMEPQFIYINPYAGIRGVDIDGFDYSCGACGVVVVESSNRGMIVGMVLRCSKCRSHNELRGL